MQSLHYLLMKSQAIFSKKVHTEITKLGLTSGQPKILEFLLQYYETDQKTIATYCEIEPATVGSILLRMENQGLVIRRKKEGNRRSLYVSLTKKGKDMALQLRTIFIQIEKEATSLLSDEEIKSLQQMLTKLCFALQSKNR